MTDTTSKLESNFELEAIKYMSSVIYSLIKFQTNTSSPPSIIVVLDWFCQNVNTCGEKYFYISRLYKLKYLLIYITERAIRKTEKIIQYNAFNIKVMMASNDWNIWWQIFIIVIVISLPL